MNDVKIANRYIGESYSPFVIAEMSGNHNQSLIRALAIVDAAADSGAHAIKLQTYTASTMTVKGAMVIKDKNSLWKDRELYDLYEEAHTPWDWHKAIFDHAKKRKIIAFSSPFDETAVDFLEKLGAPAYKIASFENTDHPLLKKVAKTKKPVIMSTGVATIAQIDEAVRILKENGCKQLVLLKCTSTYPASPENTNIRTIPHLRQLFGCTVGISDHTMGIGTSVGAVALGARVIEKHFTLKRSDGGVDSTFSLEPHELKALVVESERAFLSLGEIKYGMGAGEKKNTRYKRSIYFVKDLKSGERINAANVKVLRPADGLEPKYLDLVMGKKVLTDVKSGTPLDWKHLMG